jgi:hypothetical protein
MGHFEDRAVQYIVKLIADFGLEDFQAAAVPGNFGTESGGFTQTQEINPTSGRGGLGDGQWTGPRRRDFEAWLARNEDKNWQPDTFDANYSMLFRELVGPESHTIPALKAATTLEQATEAFMNQFERPGVPNLPNRISWAKKALAAFHAAGSPVAAKLPPAPQIGQILAPLPKIDPNQLAPLIQAALPIILQLLTARVQGSTGAQPGQGIDLAGILGQLISGLAPQPVTPPPPPPVKVEVAAPVNPPKTGLALSLAGLFTSFGAMATGHLGTPLGMGTDPTTAGNLVPLAFTAAAAIASTGVFGPAGAVIGRVLGAIGPALTNKPKP